MINVCRCTVRDGIIEAHLDFAYTQRRKRECININGGSTGAGIQILIGSGSILDIIRKGGFTDAVIVVTRYFGGTLLGTGGLVRAYTQAALGALNKGTPVVYDIYSTLKIAISYSDHGRICQALDEAGFVVDDTAFAANVEVTGRIKASETQALIARLTEVTSARVQVEEIEQKFDCL